MGAAAAQEKRGVLNDKANHANVRIFVPVGCHPPADTSPTQSFARVCGNNREHPVSEKQRSHRAPSVERPVMTASAVQVASRECPRPVLSCTSGSQYPLCNGSCRCRVKLHRMFSPTCHLLLDGATPDECLVPRVILTLGVGLDMGVRRCNDAKSSA